MVLALVDDHPHVLHRVAGDGATVEHLAHAFLHRRQELAGDGAALDLVDELEAATARQRLDAQEHLAELAGAAGLLLVPVVALGLRGPGFALGDARRARGDIDAMAPPQPGEVRSEEHTSELQSLMRTSHAAFSLKKKT